MYCVEWTQYSIRLKRSTICNRFSLGPPESWTQTVSRSLPNFLLGSPGDRQTDLATRSFTISGIYLCSKGKEEYLNSAIYILCISQNAQAWITEFYMQLHFSFVSVHQLRRQKCLLFEFCFSVRTCETSCFTYCIRWGIVSRDSVVDGDWLHATWLMSRVMKYDTIAIELRTSRNIWGVGCLYGAYSPEERIWINSNGKNGDLTSSRRSV